MSASAPDIPTHLARVLDANSSAPISPHWGALRYQAPSIDEVGVAERVARFRSRSIKAQSKRAAIDLAMRMIDLTTLEGKDTPGKVRQLCAKAKNPGAGAPPVAAVCVYSNMARIARQAVEGTGLHVAAVSTSFPSGMSSLKLRLEETRWAVAEGADEIDMVISRGRFLCGEDNAIFDEVAHVKEACGPAHLKVILETGELQTLDAVRRASEIAMDAGADFIKTSTGKVSPAATMDVTYVMLCAIRDYFERTGRMVGMKPAGGIRDTKTAISYLVMVKETLGPAWLSPDWFRIGASSLANDLLMQIVKERTKAYQSPLYFSAD